MADTTSTPADTRSDDTPVLWSTRLLRRALLDADGSTIGSIHDIVLSPEPAGRRPRLRGFVAGVDRRQIFIHQARVDAVDRDGVHLRGGTVDLRRFKRRPGELLVAVDVLGTDAPKGPITDVGLIPHPNNDGTWIADQIASSPGSRFRRGPLRVDTWDAVASRFQPDAMAGELARLRDLHKADAAEAIQSLSPARRTALTSALEASRLADVLEELPEEEQASILSNLATEDAVAVLEEMEIDDEIDLLKELAPSERETLLAQMEPGEVAKLRALLSYREDTAGGMMNPEPIILSADATVAQAIARLRDTDLPPALSVRLFVTEPPTATPTGTYIGSVTLPRLLREPPTHLVGDLVAGDEPTLSPGDGEQEVAALLARYDLLAVAVVDAAHRLVGVVTVDDMLIRLIEQTGR